jgi:AcrR family transcriptional regulator
MKLTNKKSERTRKLVEVAAQLFARQGYHGTSTRQIADFANVHEVTLFRHFRCKEDIFWAALRSSLSEISCPRELYEGFVRGDPLQTILPQILEMWANVAIHRPELPRLLTVAVIEMPGKAETIIQESLMPMFSAISCYLGTKIQGGEVRRINPVTLATALASTVITYPTIAKLIGDIDSVQWEDSQRIREYAAFWLELISPAGIPSLHTGQDDGEAANEPRRPPAQKTPEEQRAG